MKRYKLTNWTYSKDIDCLLFFALRIRELVFDFTFDSFKYPALNTSTICKEALDLIKEIENENASEKNIIPILEELIFKVNNDYIVKLILKEDVHNYINFGDYSDLKEIRIKIEILYNKVKSNKYSTHLKTTLKEKILENKEKRVIYDLATNFVCTIINLGYNQSYIFEKINHFFFSNHPIVNVDVLDNFFQIFEKKEQKFVVVLKASRIFNEIKSSSSSFECEITDNLEEEIIKLDKKNFFQSKNKKETFLIVRNIRCLDPISAKNVAESRVNKLAKLFVFFHHQNHPEWSKSAMVISDHSISYLVKENISPMEKTKYRNPKKAEIKLNELIRNFKLDKTSIIKYNRVIDLHGLSVKNRIIENQLLQNWIAFETLLVGYSSLSKIDQVINHLIPFIMNRYLRRKIDALLNDLITFDMNFISRKIRTISEGSNFIEKFCSLLLLEKHKSIRLEFYNRLELNPLLKFRISEFHKIYNDINKVKIEIELHERKLIWQIRRMYRSRNLIVHAGVVPKFTEILVENSHSYLDMLVNTINHLNIKEGSIISIEQAIKEMEIIYRQNRKQLSSLSSINDNNCLLLIS